MSACCLHTAFIVASPEARRPKRKRISIHEKKTFSALLGADRGHEPEKKREFVCLFVHDLLSWPSLRPEVQTQRITVPCKENLADPTWG